MTRHRISASGYYKSKKRVEEIPPSPLGGSTRRRFLLPPFPDDQRRLTRAQPALPPPGIQQVDFLLSPYPGHPKGTPLLCVCHPCDPPRFTAIVSSPFHDTPYDHPSLARFFPKKKRPSSLAVAPRTCVEQPAFSSIPRQMPVPVPCFSKPSAHHVLKKSLSGQSNPFQGLTCSLPVSPPGPPPSFGTREEWINSLPSWRRTKPRRIWEDDPRFAGHRAEQDFCQGLAVAHTNASAIKGARAEACIPPMYTILRTDLPLGSDGDADDEMSSDYSALDRVPCDNDSQWSNSSLGMDVDYQSQLDISTSSPASDLPNYDEQLYERGAFTPVFEDQSPGVYSGPDVGSSPVGPVTPFGEFVDRAVAAESYATYDESLSAKSQAALQEHFGSGSQSYNPVDFPPYIAGERLKAEAPVPDVVTPSATSGYRKLAEPLSDWVANYVWKACSTGFSLPAAFSRPSYVTFHPAPRSVAHVHSRGNVVKQRSAFPPTYLASAVHSLLLSTLLQPSAVFLAIWYIVRLPVYYDAAALNPDYVKELRFRATLLANGLDQDAIEASAPFRLIVLGCMLANKWLDDHTFSNKTWHTISNVPIQTLNTLESLALDIFAYDLSVTSTDWSQWLAHLVSYHQMSSSPSHPQPISRPSTNPYAIVRRALDEIIQAPAACNFNSASPQPVFMGLEERRRERMEKEQARSVDVLEIDLDEDGPLREEYLPKRRISGAGSTHSNFHPHDTSARAAADNTQNWQSHKVVEKSLPPPARWSPAADEPILRERNRASGQYVAVQPPLLPPMLPYPMAQSYHPGHDLGYPNQNWPPGGAFVAVKPAALMGYVFDAPPLHVAHPAYAAYHPFAAPAPAPLALSHSHSRSQSLSYDQDNSHARNRLRSCSQSGFEFHCHEAHMGASELPPVHEADRRWGAPAHYGYPAPAFAAPPMQPAWLRS
ncbi:hypothetical protein B0H11DRAFT_1902617 [Mycena galericulata]|nr:hypothetical protein B0H11DRAFT_1902617 [Mycena galericulata]